MKFSRFPLDDAEGVRLAHTLPLPGKKLRKGHLLTAADIAVLAAAGVADVLGAKLAGNDVDEDTAAASAAALVASDGLRAERADRGRCNLRAAHAGLLLVDAATVEKLNRIDAALTLGTLPPNSVVAPGQVVATLKTIPFAVAAESIKAWREQAGLAASLRLAPFRPHRVALICSRGEATTESLLDKTEAVTRRRVEALGSSVIRTARCAHSTEAVREELDAALAAGAEMILVTGAAVSKDRGDTVPAAIVAAGGDIVHFGMPVEPGNMLLLARIGAVAVVNLPGCARSPRSNGFDWVLQRLAADLPVGSGEIMAMGAGGLILASASETLNPALENAPRIAALILAAGRSSRMGSSNKLLCTIAGKPMLQHAVDAACASRCVQTMVVSGHEAEAVEALLAGHPVSLVRNADYASGMASSLRCGLRALPADIDGVLVLLADMPHITAAHIDRLIEAYEPRRPMIVVPEKDGRRGNPILWPRRFFAAMHALGGDQGARALLERHADAQQRVAMADDAIFTDVDTPAALAALAG